MQVKYPTCPHDLGREPIDPILALPTIIQISIIYRSHERDCSCYKVQHTLQPETAHITARENVQNVTFMWQPFFGNF